MDEENTLFPVEESPEFIDDGDQLDRDYHYTVAWDVEKQDFVLNGKGQMEQCEAWKGIKCGAARWLLQNGTTVLLIRMKLALSWLRLWRKIVKRRLSLQ